MTNEITHKHTLHNTRMLVKAGLGWEGLVTCTAPKNDLISEMAPMTVIEMSEQQLLGAEREAALATHGVFAPRASLGLQRAPISVQQLRVPPTRGRTPGATKKAAVHRPAMNKDQMGQQMPVTKRHIHKVWNIKTCSRMCCGLKTNHPTY
jgi:hypothetical protein